MGEGALPPQAPAKLLGQWLRVGLAQTEGFSEARPPLASVPQTLVWSVGKQVATPCTYSA